MTRTISTMRTTVPMPMYMGFSLSSEDARAGVLGPAAQLSAD
jgi:hypothetical protein